MKKEIGLFFGSFNPIHVGHLMIAAHIYESSTLNQIWFVVSPHNPLKAKKTLLSELHRLTLVNIAIEDDNRFKACDVEFKMPKPSFTIDTLVYLHEKYPTYTFTLIMGSDTLDTLDKWKNYQYLLDNYKVIVYPRPNSLNRFIDNKNVSVSDAPLIEISSSAIRKLIKEKKEFKYYVTDRVHNYIKEMHFFEK